MEVDFSCYNISWPVALAHGMSVTGMHLQCDPELIQQMQTSCSQVIPLTLSQNHKIVSFLFSLSEV